MCTLALAIAAATTVFSYVNALLLRPFPFREPDQLVEIRTVSGGETGKLSMREVFDLQELILIIESIAAHSGNAGGYNFSGYTKPMGWKSILTTAGIVLASTMMASLLPAIRAGRVDPIIALREE